MLIIIFSVFTSEPLYDIPSCYITSNNSVPSSSLLSTAQMCLHDIWWVLRTLDISRGPWEVKVSNAYVLVAFIKGNLFMWNLNLSSGLIFTLGFLTQTFATHCVFLHYLSKSSTFFSVSLTYLHHSEYGTIPWIGFMSFCIVARLTSLLYMLTLKPLWCLCIAAYPCLLVASLGRSSTSK